MTYFITKISGKKTGKKGCKMTYEPTGLMEPMLPERDFVEIDNLVFELVQKSSALASQISPIVQNSVGDLVRSLNCYYSNLIEGHNTHPWDIERACINPHNQQPV